ncbi:hypothetical protein HY251_08815 [bacterium]|nr:hypothetical protein [bacterium]
MSDPVDQGPLDPAFAKFREKKLIEKLSEKVNAPFPGDAPAEKVREPAAPSGSEPVPFFGTGMPRRTETGSEGDEDARAHEPPRPAGVPEKVGETLRLIDIATEGSTGAKTPSPAQAPKPAPAQPVLAKAQAPAAKAPAPAPAAKAPAPAAKAPAPAAKAPAPAAKAPAPAAKAPAPTARQEPAVARASGGGDDDSLARAPSVQDLSPRPEGRADDGQLAEKLGSVRKGLSTLLSELGHRLLELKVGSAEGIERAIASFEHEASRVNAAVERGQFLSDESLKAASEANTHMEAQDSLEERTGDLTERARKLRERADELRAALVELEANRAELETRVAERAEAVLRARSQVDILAERLASLDQEAEVTGALRSRLTENVERLERIKQESASAIARLKENKEALTAHV